MEKFQLPVACNLTEPELRDRRESVLQKIKPGLAEMKEMENGYALRFPSDGAWLAELAALVNLEKQCCPFLRFNIIVEPANGPIWLEMTGPTGTKDFLETVFDSTDGANL